MAKYFLCFILFQGMFISNTAQKVVQQYTLEDHSTMSVTVLKISDNAHFTYFLERHWGRNSWAFGKVIKKGKRNILKSQTRDFDLNINYSTCDTIQKSKILIKDIRYKHLTEEPDAFLILNKDFKNKIIYEAPYATQIDSNTKSVQLLIDRKMYTKTIAVDKTRGNSLSIEIETDFPIDSFAFLINNAYYIKAGNKIKFYGPDGKYWFEMD